MSFLTLLAALLALLSAPAFARPESVVVPLDNGVGRTVPVTLVKPEGRLRGVLFFSHGALSSPAKYAALTEKWAAAGYFVVAPLHGDSTDWTGTKPLQADPRITPTRRTDQMARLLLNRLPIHLIPDSKGFFPDTVQADRTVLGKPHRCSSSRQGSSGIKGNGPLLPRGGALTAEGSR